MADNIEIIIGANAQQLQAELTAATNELRKLESQLKKSTDVNEITQLTTSIRYVKEAIVGLNQESKLLSGSLNKISQPSAQASQSLLNLSRIAQDAPFGFMGIANNINPLVESFGRLKAESGSTGGAISALVSGLAGPAGLGLAIGIGTSLLTVFSKEISNFTKGIFGASAATEELKKQKDELNKVTNQAYSESAKEATQVLSMIAVLKSETETRVRKNDALKELSRINPEIFGGLKLEKDLVNELDIAYKNYIENQKNVIAAKVIQAKIEKKIEELLKAEGKTLVGNEKMAFNYSNAQNQITFLENRLKTEKLEGNALRVVNEQLDRARKQLSTQTKTKTGLSEDIQNLVDQLSEVSKGIKVPVSATPKVKVEKIKKQDKIDFIKGLAELITVEPITLNIPVSSVNLVPFKGMPKLVAEDVYKTLQEDAKALKIPKVAIPFSVSVALKSDYLTQLKNNYGLLINANAAALKNFYDEYNKIFKDAAEKAKEQQVQTILDFSTGTLGLLGTTLGNVLMGGSDSIKNAFKGLFGLIGDGLIQLGKYAILYSQAIIKLKIALSAGKGITGIAIGIGCEKL